MNIDQDRNFDDLAARFKRNVYDQLKGEIRLAILLRDLQEVLSGPDADPRAASLDILDAGGGQGQIGLSLAQQGHRLLLCDISAAMLDLARHSAAELGVADNVEFLHASIQSLDSPHLERYDLVLCHAVLEWVADPQIVLQKLVACLRPGGYLSLTFYNVNSIIMKNLLRANFDKVLKEDFRGGKGSLTPTWPRRPDEVMHWLAGLPLERLCHSGMRCFHDYLLGDGQQNRQPEKQLALELKLSRLEPWRSLARYIHVVSRKSLA